MSVPDAGYVVLDTDAFSWLVGNKPQAAHYGAVLRGQIPAVTFITVAEVNYGAMLAGWGDTRIADMREKIKKVVNLPYDDQLPILWAEIRTWATRSGHALGQPEHNNDLWVAASAVYYDAPLLTGNVRHMAGVPGLSVIDGSSAA